MRLFLTCAFVTVLAFSPASAFAQTVVPIPTVADGLNGADAYDAYPALVGVPSCNVDAEDGLSCLGDPRASDAFYFQQDSGGDSTANASEPSGEAEAGGESEAESSPN